MKKSLAKTLIISVIIFVAAIFASLFLSYYLSINFWLILLTNSIVFCSFNVPVVRGVLQGRKKFGYLGVSFVLEAIIKLFLAISLVFIGFKIFGAIIGVLVGAFSALLFTLYFNRDISKEKEEKTSFKGIYSESIHYFVAMLVIMLFFNIDVILAKRFFSPEMAGEYAALAMLGRIVFLGTVSISKTMFPFTSEGQEIKKDTKRPFKKSLFLVFILSAIASTIYYLYPKLIIYVLYGDKYLNVSPILVYSAIALGFLSLTNLVLLYCLSTRGLKNSYYLFIFVAIEMALLFLYHETLLQYILAFMVSNIIMFIGSLFFLKR